MEQRIPLMILPEVITRPLSHLLLGVGHKIARFMPGLAYDIEESGLDTRPSVYATNALVHALFFFTLFFGMLFVLTYKVTGRTLTDSLELSFLSAGGIFLLMLVVLLKYPGIIAGKKAEQIDSQLIFALKDLLLQVGSGVSLYNGFVNVAKAGYGLVSVEFERASRSIAAGMPMAQALERMAVESKSAFLRRTIWQLVSTLKAGASIKGALRTIIDDLTLVQRSKIEDYARELNLWTLVYMMFAVAIPTIGAVMLVILSSFGGANISRGLFVGFLVGCVFVQCALIGFVKSRRPVVSV